MVNNTKYAVATLQDVKLSNSITVRYLCYTMLWLENSFILFFQQSEFTSKKFESFCSEAENFFHFFFEGTNWNIFGQITG